MNWLEITLKTTANFSVDTIEEALFAAGALSVTLSGENPQEILIEKQLGEQPLWQQDICITGLFEKGVKKGNVLPILRAVLDSDSLPLVNFKTFSDSQWETAWADQIKPIAFSNNLWVCPSDQTIPSNQIHYDTQIITMDAGLAFGSGTHQTTAMVLEYLSTNIPKSQSVLDFGCGSGILGIAALKLGANNCIMTDIDPIALDTSQENISINQLTGKASFYLPEHIPKVQVDLLIANILLEPLLMLKETFYELCKPDATLLLTGLLDYQVEKILTAYKPLFNYFECIQKDEWAMIIASQKPNVC